MRKFLFFSVVFLLIATSCKRNKCDCNALSEQVVVLNHIVDSLQQELHSCKGQLEQRHAMQGAAGVKLNMAAVKKLNKSDDGTGTTWYYQPYFVHQNNSNLMSLAIGVNANGAWLQLKMSYTGYNGIFFTHAYLAYDGHVQEIAFDEHHDKKSEHSGAGLSEWINIPVSQGLHSYLKEFAKAKAPLMRLAGKSSFTRDLTPEEVKGLKDVLQAYDGLMRK